MQSKLIIIQVLLTTTDAATATDEQEMSKIVAEALKGFKKQGDGLIGAASANKNEGAKGRAGCRKGSRFLPKQQRTYSASHSGSRFCLLSRRQEQWRRYGDDRRWVLL